MYFSYNYQLILIEKYIERYTYTHTHTTDINTDTLKTYTIKSKYGFKAKSKYVCNNKLKYKRKGNRKKMTKFIDDYYYYHCFRRLINNFFLIKKKFNES